VYKLAVMISGSGTNLQAMIDKLHRRVAGIEIAVVISNVAGVKGLARAEAAGIPTAVFPLAEYASRTERDWAMADAMTTYHPDLVVMAGYMAIVTPVFLERFSNRVINIHPALLPSFPGGDGMGDALAYGVKVTGVTVHLVEEGMDSGPIIAQRSVAVRDDDTHDTLAERVHAVEHQLYPRVVELFAKGKVVLPEPGARLVLVDDTEPSEIPQTVVSGGAA
jgi:phosphoribosylglycinamide formyltransferase 1